MSNLFNLLAAIFFCTTLTPSAFPPPELNTSIQKKIRCSRLHEIGLSKATLTKNLNCLSKKAPALDKKVLKLALSAYKKAALEGAVKKPVLTVIDYSLPSSQQRMWVFDLKTQKLLYNTHVAHGTNSGSTTPHYFSNKPSSKKTSLGTFVTGNTYTGANGYSLNLDGLEPGFNDNAYSRRVVVHGAQYVEPEFIRKVGYAGRSWGCLSIAKTLARSVINTIKDGSVIFAYYPDYYYLSHSNFAAA